MNIRSALLITSLLLASSAALAASNSINPFNVFSEIHFTMNNETGAAIPHLHYVAAENVQEYVLPTSIPMGSYSFTDKVINPDPQIRTDVMFAAYDGPASNPTGALFFGVRLIASPDYVPYSNCKTYGDMSKLNCSTHTYVTYNPTTYNVLIDISK